MDSYRKRLKEEGTKNTWDRNGKLKRKKPLKKISKSQRRKLSEYYAVQKEFLARPENRYCRICEARREHGENKLINLSTEVHHRSGRGKNLSNVSEFVASCNSCRLWPHTNPKLAREWNLLK